MSTSDGESTTSGQSRFRIIHASMREKLTSLILQFTVVPRPQSRRRWSSRSPAIASTACTTRRCLPTSSRSRPQYRPPALRIPRRRCVGWGVGGGGGGKRRYKKKGVSYVDCRLCRVAIIKYIGHRAVLSTNLRKVRRGFGHRLPHIKASVSHQRVLRGLERVRRDKHAVYSRKTYSRTLPK